jgi:hypothetical protein
VKSEADAIAFGGSAKFTDVGASSKNPLAPSDDDGTGWIGSEVESNLFDAGQDSLAQCVDLGIIESDDGNPIRATLEQNEIFHFLFL